eukprot:TRINITY_DN34242_c0_g1_i1.p1 TRINITY_DN34242_c0_g1~~TRINITY_DN34242_c0_g1_i1.p1  ORF type:complete len:188 (-),score=6.69 TRINITY_DN34242_c0_g1_i1:681-1244(-)
MTMDDRVGEHTTLLLNHDSELRCTMSDQVYTTMKVSPDDIVLDQHLEIRPWEFAASIALCVFTIVGIFCIPWRVREYLYQRTVITFKKDRITIVRHGKKGRTKVKADFHPRDVICIHAETREQHETGELNLLIYYNDSSLSKDTYSLATVKKRELDNLQMFEQKIRDFYGPDWGTDKPWFCPSNPQA